MLSNKLKINGQKIMTIFFLVNIYIGYLYYKKHDDMTGLSKEISLKERIKGPLLPDDIKLIGFLKTQFLTLPSKLKYNLSSSRMYRTHSQSLTWKFMDSKLKTLFEGEPPGFFVEAGALDGEVLSNTLWLEKVKGWKGLLIEPDAANFRFLTYKNRKAWSSKSCLATTPYPKMKLFVSYNPLRKTNVIDSSFDWLTRSLTREMEEGLDVLPSQAHHDVYSTVQCFPLESYLYALNVSVVDFLSLDIQGGELEVLRNFPFHKISLRTIAVEYLENGTRGVQSPGFKRFMNDAGYSLIGISEEPDYFYIKKGDPLLKKIKYFEYIILV